MCVGDRNPKTIGSNQCFPLAALYTVTLRYNLNYLTSGERGLVAYGNGYMWVISEEVQY